MKKVFPLLLLLLFACGKEEAPRDVQKEVHESTPATIICPVNGVPFSSGSGVLVQGKDGPVELCSKGCRYQFELGSLEEPSEQGK
ncbi:MAG TPA: hypothetical protein PKA37_03120 [Planctomycetota bacterium]|jgi:hypothetical protein|nr:hypothetical protein [Planctomycetota bacterium]